MSTKKLRFNWRKWLDGFALAGKGILLATREKRFWIGFLIAFFTFGTLMNLLSGGLSKFQLMGAVGFGGTIKIIWDALIGVLGINMVFLDWLPVFCLATLQGVLIGLIGLLWDKKKEQNSANVEKAGIITGLIALGAGCPTCGTTLLTPLLGTVFSTGSLAVAGVVSWIVTAGAIVVAILSLRRTGEETYVVIVNEKFMRKKTAEENV